MLNFIGGFLVGSAFVASILLAIIGSQQRMLCKMREYVELLFEGDAESSDPEPRRTRVL